MKKLIRKIKKYITLKRGKFYIDENGVMTLPKGCKIEVFDSETYKEEGFFINLWGGEVK